MDNMSGEHHMKIIFQITDLSIIETNGGILSLNFPVIESSIALEPFSGSNGIFLQKIRIVYTNLFKILT